MTVTKTEPLIIYPNYAGPNDYNFPFYALHIEDIRVTHVDEKGVSLELLPDYDYTVVISPTSSDGGVVTTINPTEAGGSLRISRLLELQQKVDWVNNDAFDAELVERSFDSAVMMIQQLDSYRESGSLTFMWRSNWATANAYQIRDMVIGPDTSIYIGLENHTAGLWDADLANGKWELMIDVSSVRGYAEAAKADAALALQYKIDAEAAARTAQEAAAVCATIEAALNQCAEEIIP